MSWPIVGDGSTTLDCSILQLQHPQPLQQLPVFEPPQWLDMELAAAAAATDGRPDLDLTLLPQLLQQQESILSTCEHQQLEPFLVGTPQLQQQQTLLDTDVLQQHHSQLYNSSASAAAAAESPATTNNLQQQQQQES